MRVSHRLGYVVCAVIGAFILWVGLLTNLLEMRLVTLCIDFINQALQHLREGIVVTDQHSLLLALSNLLVEEALVQSHRVVHVNGSCDRVLIHRSAPVLVVLKGCLEVHLIVLTKFSAHRLGE